MAGYFEEGGGILSISWCVLLSGRCGTLKRVVWYFEEGGTLKMVVWHFEDGGMVI